MALGCGASCAKYTLFVFNLIFWLTGAALLGAGIWARVDPDVIHFLRISGYDQLVPAAAIVLIVVGAIIFITGFFGCCGAMRESSCMLATYAGILILILILQVVAGIMVVVFRNKISTHLDEHMEYSMRNEYGEKADVTQAWDAVQRHFRCCGSMHGPTDWQYSAFYNSSKSDVVPTSCCKGNATLCQVEAAEMMNGTASETPHLNDQPCRDQLRNWFKHRAAILIGIAFGLVVVQIIVATMACSLRNAVQNQYQTV